MTGPWMMAHPAMPKRSPPVSLPVFAAAGAPASAIPLRGRSAQLLCPGGGPQDSELRRQRHDEPDARRRRDAPGSLADAGASAEDAHAAAGRAKRLYDTRQLRDGHRPDPDLRPPGRRNPDRQPDSERGGVRLMALAFKPDIDTRAHSHAHRTGRFEADIRDAELAASSTRQRVIESSLLISRRRRVACRHRHRPAGGGPSPTEVEFPARHQAGRRLRGVLHPLLRRDRRPVKAGDILYAELRLSGERKVL